LSGQRSEVLLYLTVAVFGFVAMVGQALLVREALVVFYGNELSVGVVLASWFVGIFAGALVSRRFAREDERRFERLGWGILLFCFLVSLQVLNMRVVRWYMGVGVGELAPLGKLVLACMLVVAPVGVGIGLVFPLAAVAGVYFRRDAVARVYVLEALGSVAGGLAFTFLIVKYLNPLLSLVGCAAVLIILGAGVAGVGQGKKFLSIGLICAGVLIGGIVPLDGMSLKVRWGSLAGNLRLVQMKESVYQNVALGEAEGQYTIYGNGHVLDTFPDEFSLWGEGLEG